MNESTTLPDLELKAPMWPKLGDKLFKTNSGENMALLGGFGTTFGKYAIGYKDAADVLIHQSIQKNGFVDLQFYPIAFLYRQYIELRLKQLQIVAGFLPSDELKLIHSHDLRILWAPVRAVLVENWPDSYDDELNAMDACIQEFCSLDANSMSFRYPEDKTGKPTLLGLDRVDLNNLKSVMGRVSAFLDASSDAIVEMLNNMPH